MKRPPLTDKVLDGLNNALCRMEADDLSDETDETLEAVRAASRWLTRTFRYRSERLEAKAYLAEAGRKKSLMSRAGRLTLLQGGGNANDPDDPSWAEAEALEEQD